MCIRDRYWTDASHGRIESSHVNGMNRRVVSSERIYLPFGISLYRGTLYFTDFLTGINTVASTGGTVTTIFHNRCKTFVGIEVVSVERQPAGKIHCLPYNY